MRLDNPYRKTESVFEYWKFWGRTTETARIFSRIGASRPQSVSLIGEPGIGKTSIIKYLQVPEIQKTYLDDPDKTLILEKKISADSGEKPEDFTDNLARLAGGHIDVELEGPGYEGFMSLIKNPVISSLKLIFCLDDFHLVTENPNYPMEFFSFLRSIANNYNVAYVTTSPLELQRLCVSQVVEESPFFNIFTNIPLRPLKSGEARESIIDSSAAAGCSLESYVDYIIEWAGTVPDDLMCACELIFDRMEDSKRLLTNAEKNEFENEYLSIREPIFSKRWAALGTELQDVLILIISGKTIPKSRKYLVTELERKGYAGKETERYSVLSHAFARYIASVSGIKISRTSQAGGWLKRLFSHA